jgi:outer membrane protein assembly factor BamB
MLNCSGTPKTCTPLWSVTTGSAIVSSPAVNSAVVYVTSEDDKLYALDAATGATLWTANIGSILLADRTIANGIAYVAADNTLYAFDASGVANCSGTPKTCTPLWTAVGGSFHQVAVANGVVYMGSVIEYSTRLFAFDASGVTNCSGTPKVCTPLWTADIGFTVNSPTVANGLVFAGANGMYAYDATGAANCSGQPKVCTPLWTAPGSTIGTTGSPTIAHGHVYTVGDDGTLYVYGLAT